MPGATRFALSALVQLSLLVFFVSLGSILHVRTAIAAGALEPADACLTACDMERLRSGPDQYLADWWISRRVYEYHIVENRRPGLGLRGALAFYGMKLSMTPSERIEAAYTSMRPLPVCGEPVKAL
jgi:hypothetical protein